jgi:choline dehydrogenase
MFCDTFRWHIPAPPSGDYLTVIVDLTRPLSQWGAVLLHSASYVDQPSISLNFFGKDIDPVSTRGGARFLDDILMSGEAMKDHVERDDPLTHATASDEAMDWATLERSRTGSRPCGTKRLSIYIKAGVGEPGLKVHADTISCQMLEGPLIWDVKNGWVYLQ